MPAVSVRISHPWRITMRRRWRVSGYHSGRNSSSRMALLPSTGAGGRGCDGGGDGDGSGGRSVGGIADIRGGADGGGQVDHFGGGGGGLGQWTGRVAGAAVAGTEMVLGQAET